MIMEKEEKRYEEDFSLLNELEKMEVVGGAGKDDEVTSLALSNCKVVCNALTTVSKNA